LKKIKTYIEYASIFNMVETPRFQKAANKSDLKEGGLLGIEIDSKRVVLSMVEGKVYAMNSICSHKGAPLEEGTLLGYDLNALGTLLFLMYVMVKCQLEQFGQKIWNLIQCNDQTTRDILINVSSGGSADSGKAGDVT
jgi:nitrite reductase/ring-hydroxylating ferredoxin subunit